MRNYEFGKCVFEVIFLSPEKWHKTVILKKNVFIKWCKNKLNKTSYEMITYEQISGKKPAISIGTSLEHYILDMLFIIINLIKEE